MHHPRPLPEPHHVSLPEQPELKNLILDPYFREIIEKSQSRWRFAIQTAIEYGVAVPLLAPP
jgi:6-phosphogluconate dehydrogenase